MVDSIPPRQVGHLVPLAGVVHVKAHSPLLQLYTASQQAFSHAPGAIAGALDDMIKALGFGIAEP